MSARQTKPNAALISTLQRQGAAKRPPTPAEAIVAASRAISAAERAIAAREPARYASALVALGAAQDALALALGRLADGA